MWFITEKKNSFIQPELLGFNIEVPEILPVGTSAYGNTLLSLAATLNFQLLITKYLNFV
jgi:uncharacterized membrane protein YadS